MIIICELLWTIMDNVQVNSSGHFMGELTQTILGEFQWTLSDTHQMDLMVLLIQFIEDLEKQIQYEVYL